MGGSITPRSTLLLRAKPAVEQLDEFVKRHKLADDLAVDHICYKCQDGGVFDSVRRGLEEQPVRFSYMSYISGRRICYVGLDRDSLKTESLGSIDFLELSDAKPGKLEATGFHHIEVYLSGTRNPHDQPFIEDLVAHLKKGREKVVFEERPHHPTYDVVLPNGFIIRICHGPLLYKIKSQEML